MAISKPKDPQAAPVDDRKGKLVARPPRPGQGNVDYDGLIKEFMKQYRKTRAHLAK